MWVSMNGSNRGSATCSNAGGRYGITTFFFYVLRYTTFCHRQDDIMFCCLATIVSIILLYIWSCVLWCAERIIPGEDLSKDSIKIKTAGEESNDKSSDKLSDYPYHRKWRTLEDVNTAFELIQNYTYKIAHKYHEVINSKKSLTFKLFGSPTVISCLPEDYYKMNWVSDWFNEQCRIKCRRYDEKYSPLEWFEKNRDLIKKIPGSEAQNDAIYKEIRGCNNFRPGLLSGMIKFLNKQFGLNITNVLDPCSGWGDRLIGAIAAGVSYTGVDPNTCLVTGYQKIIEYAKDQKIVTNNQQFTMLPAKIQDCEFPSESFQLAFTSPPYFNLELYEGSDLNQESNLAAWLDEFLYPMLRKVTDAVCVGGFIIMIINDVRDGPQYTDFMIAEMEKLDTEYFGALSYADLVPSKIGAKYLKSPQPMWVWRKLPAKDQNLSTKDLSIKDLAIKDHLYVQNLSSADSRTFTIIRDDLLPGGTKQRGFDGLKAILPPETKEIVYAGPYTGIAQMAITQFAGLADIRAVCFLSRDDYYLTQRARAAGCRIERRNTDLKGLQAAAQEYCANHPERFLLPFGFAQEEIISAMTNNIRAASQHCINISTLEKTEKIFDEPNRKRIWLVAGSATLLTALARIWPDTQFNVVQVGKTIWPDQLPANAKLYISSEPFSAPAEIQPPYPTVPAYDAKLWKFVLEYGESGDIVWNVAQ